MENVRIYEGLSELCDSYQAFILDQWGVLHNGVRPYNGVVEALEELKRRGKRMFVLSNSGKRARVTQDRLKELGIDPALFEKIVTSGEMTWDGLCTRTSGLFEGLGENCFLLSRGDDTGIIDGTGVSVVDDVAKADFILLSGSDAPQKTMADYEAVLRPAVQRRLVMLCANPDMEMVQGTQLAFGAGAIAKRYQDFGGVVGYIGKPHAPIIRYVQSLMPDVLPASTLVVGDSLAHDILGGEVCSIDTCLVATGVHNTAFKNVVEREGAERALRHLAKTYGLSPNFFIPSFRWGKPLLDRKNKKASKK